MRISKQFFYYYLSSYLSVLQVALKFWMEGLARQMLYHWTTSLALQITWLVLNTAEPVFVGVAVRKTCHAGVLSVHPFPLFRCALCVMTPQCVILPVSGMWVIAHMLSPAVHTTTARKKCKAGHRACTPPTLLDNFQLVFQSSLLWTH